MQKKKPVFFSKVFAIFEVIMIIAGIILGAIFTNDKFSTIQIIVYISTICLLIFIFSLFINGLIYSGKMYKYCDEIEQNREELSRIKTKNDNEIQKLNLENSYFEYMFMQLITLFELAIINGTEEEQTKLKKTLELLYMYQVNIINLKGEFINGKRI